jgi:hypothetical protein
MELTAKVTAIYGWFGLFYFEAILAALVLALVALGLTRNRRDLRSGAVASSIALPFGCVAYAVIMVAIWIVTVGPVRSTAPPNGDAEPYPLPNGYVLTVSRDWNYGYITQGLRADAGTHGPHREAVTAIQVSGALVLGRSDLTDSPDLHYFMLDTRRNVMMEFINIQYLRNEAAKRGVAVRLQKPRMFVSQIAHYGLPWWMYLILLGPVLAALARWFWQLWQASRAAETTAA